MLDCVLNSSLLYKTEIHEWKIVFFSGSRCIEPGMIWFSYWTVSFIISARQNSVRWLLSYQISITISQRQTYHFFNFFVLFLFFRKGNKQVSRFSHLVTWTECYIYRESSSPTWSVTSKVPIPTQNPNMN